MTRGKNRAIRLAMGTVHRILEERGKQEALKLDLDREIVEAAATYLGDEGAGIGYLYSGWCQAALPHRRLPDSQGWQVSGERVRLIVEPGMRGSNSGVPQPVGVPYGSRARLILIYLQSQALKTGSREVELGTSLRDWMGRMSLPIGGCNLQIVREQTERISRCRLTFEVRQGNRLGMENQSITDSAIFLDADHPGQGNLFAQVARLSEPFFDRLKRHPVPLEEAAIGAIANNSMALDVYAWLVYRLHALARPTPVSWPAVKAQFGAGYDRLRNFRARFLPNLRLALAVYPDARVAEDDRGAGLVLYPSRPPVAPRVA